MNPISSFCSSSSTLLAGLDDMAVEVHELVKRNMGPDEEEALLLQQLEEPNNTPAAVPPNSCYL